MKHILFISIAACLVSSCVNDQDDIQKLNVIPDHTTQTIEDVEIIRSDSAVVNVRITGPIYKIVQDEKEPYIEFPNGVHVEFFDKQKNIYSDLKADYAIKYDKKEETVFKRNVVFKNADNETLMTEELIWDQKNKRIFSNEFVEIETIDNSLTGEGFEADEDFSNYSIKKLIGRIKINKDEINSDL